MTKKAVTTSLVWFEINRYPLNWLGQNASLKSYQTALREVTQKQIITIEGESTQQLNILHPEWLYLVSTNIFFSNHLTHFPLSSPVLNSTHKIFFQFCPSLLYIVKFYPRLCSLNCNSLFIKKKNTCTFRLHLEFLA